MAKGEREGSSLLLLWPTLFGAGAMSYSRSSVQSQTIPPMSNRDSCGRGRRSVLCLGERSESSPDSMITSPVPTTEVPSPPGSGICPCRQLFGQVELGKMLQSDPSDYK